MGCAASLVSSIVVNESFYDKYRLGEKLGEGGFGQVRACKDRETELDYAVKVVDARRSPIPDVGDSYFEVDSVRVRAAKAEVNSWQKIRPYAHCVRLYKHFYEDGLFFMVMERCECSLMDFMLEDPAITQSGLAALLRQMLLGISHCHACKIVHRDIKPDNFLRGGPNGSVLKLCDFGLSVSLPRAGQQLKGVYGTTPFMSPEMLNEKGYAFGTDVWSFGATAYLMLYGTFPYSAPEETPKEELRPIIKEAIKQGKPEPSFEQIFQEDPNGKIKRGLRSATSFVQTVLVRDPRQRVSAREALQHEYLNPQAAVLKSSEEGGGEEAEEQEEDLPIDDRIRAATVKTIELKASVNVEAQRGLDRTIKKHLARLGRSVSPIGLAKEEGVVNSKSRCRTHNGVVRRKPSNQNNCHHADFQPVLVTMPNSVDHTATADNHKARQLY